LNFLAMPGVRALSLVTGRLPDFGHSLARRVPNLYGNV
jgi:hypothetical protein